MAKKKKTTVYEITADWPTPIVKDFDCFIEAVQAPSVYLTKANQHLNRATLYDLNQKMLTWRSDEKPTTDQPYYLLLNLFQHICISARFFNLGVSKSKVRLTATPVLQAYRELKPAEKYMALLEAAWNWCDWSELVTSIYAFREPMNSLLMKVLLMLPVNQEIDQKQIMKEFRRNIDSSTAPGIRLLTFFGFMVMHERELSAKEKKQYSRGYIDFQSICVTQFGHDFLTILNHERPFEAWNMPNRMEWGGADFPGQTFDDETDESSEQVAFIDAFEHLLTKDSVTQGLPKPALVSPEGTFVFKVSLEDIWRTIALSGNHTLEDLHRAIQDAYDFDDDHLYAFSMNPRRLDWRKSYHDSRGEDGPYADEAYIGKLYLYTGQHLLYVFDFGDNWHFAIKVQEIKDQPFSGQPRILKSQGESPQQYPDYEDEDW